MYRDVNKKVKENKCAYKIKNKEKNVQTQTFELALCYKRKKVIEKKISETKHWGLVKNRSRSRIKGTLLVLGALYQ